MTKLRKINEKIRKKTVLKKAKVEKKITTKKSEVKLKKKVLRSLTSEGAEKITKNEVKTQNNAFNVTNNVIKRAVESIIKFRSENPKLKNDLFENESFALNLQISCHKIPIGAPKVHRIELKHSLHTPESDVCLIVADVKNIPNKNHEEHVGHYESLLREKGVDFIKKIMTFHEFRTEYETFELRNRLVDLYDVFLSDGKICGKVVGKCGKPFYAKRKLPIPVKLRATKLKDHLEKCMRKVMFHLHLKGNSYSVQFGHNQMSSGDLIDNITAILEFLQLNFPGGVDNISGIHVTAFRGSSIPIYLSTKSPNEVETPKITPKKPKKYKTYIGDLTTKLNRKVRVDPMGNVTVLMGNNKDEDREETEAEGREFVKELKRKNKTVKKSKTRDLEGNEEENDEKFRKKDGGKLKEKKTKGNLKIKLKEKKKNK